MSWLRNVARIVPEDQGSTIALAFLEHSYTSVEVIKEEDTNNIVAIPGIQSLKAGAMVALMLKLAELKVCTLCHQVLLLPDGAMVSDTKFVGPEYRMT
jgi:hypothetical protein